MFRTLVGLVVLAATLPVFVSAQENTCPNLTRNLSLGSKGNDVVQLQKFLIMEGALGAGNSTGYYGKLTQAAVKEFQCTNNIVCSGLPARSGWGNVGPKTRAEIKRICELGSSRNGISIREPDRLTPLNPDPYVLPPSGTVVNTYTQGSYYSQGAYSSAGTSTQSTVQQNTPEAFGAVGNGTTDDTAALQKAIDANSALILISGKTYRISRTLTLKSGLTIYSDGSATILLGSNSGEFTNMTLAGKFAANAVGLHGTNVNNVTLKNFKIKKEYKAGSVVSGVVIRGGSGHLVEKLDISGFSSGEMIRMDTVADSRITDNYLHDGTQRVPENTLSGVAIDADRMSVSGVVRSSSGLVIKNNAIRELNMSTELASMQNSNYQTNGISTGPDGSGFYITDNTFYHVSQAIDHYADNSFIDNNYIEDVDAAGIKLIHGATNNYVRYNKIHKAGLYGIYIVGSNSIAKNTSGNIITANEIHNTGKGRATWPEHTRGGIWLDPHSPELGFVVNNQVYNNVVDGNNVVNWGISCTTNQPNEIYGNTIPDSGTLGTVHVCGGN